MKIRLNQDINWFVFLNNSQFEKKALINQFIILNKIQELKDKQNELKQILAKITENNLTQ